MSNGSLHVRQREIPPELVRRATRCAFFVVAVFGLLLLRLAYLQISLGDYYRSLSENNRVRIESLRPIRGVIVDRSGEILVDNRPSFDLVVVPEDAGDLSVTLANLSHFLGESGENGIAKALSAASIRRPFEAVTLERGVDWATVVAVESHRIDLPGVSLRVGPQRRYRYKLFASPLLGYVGEISRSELEQSDGYRMGDLIGKAGIERALELYLHGRSGGRQVEVDAFGRQLRVLSEVPPVAGDTVVLAIDADLQRAAERALGEHEGAVVVMDVNTGEILAMASKPGFDPNWFAQGVTREQWSELVRNPLRPLNNRAVLGLYPPGSTFKVVMAAAALEEGVIGPQTEFFCGGGLWVGTRRFRCWRSGGHGRVNVMRALIESCDVFFYEVGQRLGVDRIAEYAHRLGLGRKTGIDLPAEKPGLIPTTRWKRRRLGQPWFPGETISVAIGQGYVLVTPLQMAQLTAAIANGGRLLRPRLVKRVETVDGRVVWDPGDVEGKDVGLSSRNLELIRKAMLGVVNTARGTGQAARLETFGREQEIEVAGKTGTAQASAAGGGRGSQRDWKRELRDHAWFVAFAPFGQPQVAIAVLVEHAGEHGGRVAAPIAREVLANYFFRDRSGETASGAAEARGRLSR